VKRLSKKWNTTNLIVTGSLSILSVLLLMIGSTIAVVTGVPLAGGFINVLIHPIMTVLVLLIIDNFGSGILYQSIIGLFSIFLPMAGTPGLILKLPLYLIAGILNDGIYISLKNKKRMSSMIVGGVNQLYFLFGIVFMGKLVNMPGIEKTIDLFLNPLMVVATLLAGTIGGYIGYFIYNKIKNTTVVKRIQGNNDQKYLHSEKIDSS